MENGSSEPYFDAIGKPVNNSAEGSARVTRKYDPRGNAIESCFFGTDGQPILELAAMPSGRGDTTGAADLIEGTYFGTNGQPVRCIDGYAKWAAEYDPRGNQIKLSYFAEDSSPGSMPGRMGERGGHL